MYTQLTANHTIAVVVCGHRKTPENMRIIAVFEGLVELPESGSISLGRNRSSTELQRQTMPAYRSDRPKRSARAPHPRAAVKDEWQRLVVCDHGFMSDGIPWDGPKCPRCDREMDAEPVVSSDGIIVVFSCPVHGISAAADPL